MPASVRVYVWWAGQTHTHVYAYRHIQTDNHFSLLFSCVFFYLCVSVSQSIWLCLCVCVCERQRKLRIGPGVAVQFCQLYGLVLTEGRSSPPLTPICPVRVSHKVRSLLIMPVPDGRFMEDESEGLIRFPVLFGAKVSSFLNTFSTTLSITLNSSPNRKLQKRLASFVGLHMHVCLC